MDIKYKIEKLEYNTIAKLLKLYAVCFNREKDADFFKWKYFDNPAGEALCLTVMCDGDIIGSCAMIPEQFCVFGAKRTIFKCCDLMVHPGYRKQGLSSRLISSLAEHLRQRGPLFLYTFCSKNATPGFLKNKWLKVDDVKYYFKHISQLRIKFLFNDIKKLYHNGTLREIGSISELCEKYTFRVDETKIHILENESYLKWRLKNKYYKYKFVGYYENEILNGYIVYSIANKTDTYIIDLKTNESGNNCAKALLTAAESDTHESGCRSIMALVIRGTPFHGLIRGNGYITNPFGRGPLISMLDFNVLTDAGQGEKVFDKFNWDLLPISYDDI